MKYITLLLLLINLIAYSQTTETVALSDSDPHDLYRSNDKDSSTLFYKLIIPKIKPVAALIILPGTGDLLTTQNSR